MDKITAISFATLSKMSRAPIIRAVINTRKEQVAEFAHPQIDKYSKGFIIRKKQSGVISDKQNDQELSAKEEKEIEKIISFLENGGEEENRWHADSFETFIRKMVEDSLTLDQYTFEIIRYRNKDLAEFYAVDGESIRLSDMYDESSVKDQRKKEAMIDGYLPSYVQLFQNRIVAEFYPWELGFGVRNPQTRLAHNGYGKSELEDLIQTVTAMLNADTYNANFFKAGSNPKGMLMIKKAGGINSDTLNEFKSQWASTMQGVDNMHKTAALDADHVEWLDLHKNNKDMEFDKYQQYLIKLACAIYKISPEEVGFPLEGSNKGGINNGGGKGHELNYSKEKGLQPILRNIQYNINKYLVGPKTNYKYEFAFVGLDTESEAEEEERLIKAVGGPYMEVNEARAKRGLDTSKKEYDTLGTMVGQGNASSDAFMDSYMNDDEDMEPENIGGGEKENPMMKSFEDYMDRELLTY